MRSTFFLASAVAATLFAGDFIVAPARAEPASCPPVMLWLWERPERTDFIKDRDVGFAVLARRIRLSGNKAMVVPRTQRLTLPRGHYVTAVARIETSGKSPPAFTDELVETTAAFVAELAHLPDVKSVQVDFDAKVSERPFYRALLKAVRRLLPAGTGLSMTALASWCIHDRWLAGLPVDEVVPMLFRMGADRHHIIVYLESGGHLARGPGRPCLGLSVDEPQVLRALAARPADILNPESNRRVYLFSPKRWSEASVRQALAEVKRWQTGPSR